MQVGSLLWLSVRSLSSISGWSISISSSSSRTVRSQQSLEPPPPPGRPSIKSRQPREALVPPWDWSTRTAKDGQRTTALKAFVQPADKRCSKSTSSRVTAPGLVAATTSGLKVALFNSRKRWRKDHKQASAPVVINSYMVQLPMLTYTKWFKTNNSKCNDNRWQLGPNTLRVGSNFEFKMWTFEYPSNFFDIGVSAGGNQQQ